MLRLSRRRLLLLTARIAAALGVLRGATIAASAAENRIIAREGHASFPKPLLDALGATVLPSELGPAGLAEALRRFEQWILGYRAGAESNHAYPGAPIVLMPPSPLPRWQQQLDALDAAAPGGFAALDLHARQALVAAALAQVEGGDLPPPAMAPHIALAIVAHFFQSPQGTDLCYRAAIGKTRCRLLEEAPHAPRELRAEDLA